MQRPNEQLTEKAICLLQGIFFTQPGIDFSDDYKNQILTQFNILYGLINSIQAVKIDTY